MKSMYRTVWLSDIHLGTRGCQAENLLSFLKGLQTENLYLMGDVIDLWALKKGIYWPSSHNNVVQEVLKKAKHGTRVIYVPGNHDELFREYIGATFGNVELHRDYIHTTSQQLKIYCTHGDDYDMATRNYKVVAHLGGNAYDFLVYLNRHLNAIRKLFGLGYWSFAAFVKKSVKDVVKYICSYEENLVKAAVGLHVDAVLCGHIHHAEIKRVNGFLYLNTGDWVESCTAIVEHYNGELELLYCHGPQTAQRVPLGDEAATSPQLAPEKTARLFAQEQVDE